MRRVGERARESQDQEIREKVAQVIVAATQDLETENGLEFLRVWDPEDDTGPYGGRQQKVLMAVGLERRLHPVLVVVYSDGNIKDLLEETLKSEEEYVRLRKRFDDFLEDRRAPLGVLGDI